MISKKQRKHLEKIRKELKRCPKCGKFFSNLDNHSCKIKPSSKKARENISKAKLGEKNPQWKGEKVGYQALHEWVRNRKPKPEFCERCKKRKAYDLANISGKYKRDVNDYKWLCRSCHMKSDNRLFNLHKNNQLKLDLKLIDHKRNIEKKPIHLIAKEMNVSYTAIWKRLNKRRNYV